MALPGMPLVRPGDDLARLILAAVERAGTSLAPGDVLVVAQKVVSKAEGRETRLADAVITEAARELAIQVDKDPRLVALILSEARQVLRSRPGVIIVEHRLGYVMANAGIDASNVDSSDGEPRVLLLPEDPDASCRRLRADLQRLCGVAPAVIVNDSVGRAWRQGSIGTALGSAGLPALWDLRGKHDLFQRPLMVTQVGLADEIASAGSLLQGQADEGTPVVLLRGLELPQDAGGADALLRPLADDLFR